MTMIFWKNWMDGLGGRNIDSVPFLSGRHLAAGLKFCISTKLKTAHRDFYDMCLPQLKAEPFRL